MVWMGRSKSWVGVRKGEAALGIILDKQGKNPHLPLTDLLPRKPSPCALPGCSVTPGLPAARVVRTIPLHLAVRHLQPGCSWRAARCGLAPASPPPLQELCPRASLAFSWLTVETLLPGSTQTKCVTGSTTVGTAQMNWAQVGVCAQAGLGNWPGSSRRAEVSQRISEVPPASPICILGRRFPLLPKCLKWQGVHCHYEWFLPEGYSSVVGNLVSRSQMRKPGSPEGSHKKSTYVAQLGFELGLPSSPLHHPTILWGKAGQESPAPIYM